MAAVIFMCGCSPKTNSGRDIPNLTLEERLTPSGEINGHPFVDLGLPTLWATSNLGADTPEECGEYYAWGEVSPKKKYSSRNSITYDRDIPELTGEDSYSITWNVKFDAAQKNWGGQWHLPGKSDFDELIENCTKELIEYKKVKGWLLTSKINGKAIFLPAAGYRDSQGLEFYNDHAYYWSGEADDKGDTQAYCLFIKEVNNSDRCDNYLTSRYSGIPIRPTANWCSEDY